VFDIYRINKMFDLLAGIRFAGMDLSLKGPGPADVELTRDLSLTDVYGGGRVILPLIEKWLVALSGDVGTGDSNVVWIVVAKHIALHGGYRWLEYDFEKNNRSVEEKLDMSIQGPYLGVGFMW